MVGNQLIIIVLNYFLWWSVKANGQAAAGFLVIKYNRYTKKPPAFPSVPILLIKICEIKYIIVALQPFLNMIKHGNIENSIVPKEPNIMDDWEVKNFINKPIFAKFPHSNPGGCRIVWKAEKMHVKVFGDPPKI